MTDLILQEAIIIGRVNDIREFDSGNKKVLSLYLGNQGNKQYPNHVYVSLFVNSSNKSLQKVEKGTVVQTIGTVINRNSKSGFKEVVVNPTSLYVVGDTFKVNWGIFPQKTSTVFISAIFPNDKGGYDISGSYDKQNPRISQKDGVPVLSYERDTRSFRVTASESSRAFKSINYTLSKLIDRNIEAQASQDELNQLKKCTAILDLSFVAIKSSKKVVNGVNGWNYYLNQYADNINIINRIGSGATTQSKSSSPRKDNSPAQAEQSSQTFNTPPSNMAPPTFDNDDPGFDMDYHMQNDQNMPADQNVGF